MRPLSALPPPMDAVAFSKVLHRLGACYDAREWAKGKDLATVWATCERGDWLLWLAALAGVRRQDVVIAACPCARLALRHVPEGEERPLRAIETAERWARGEPGVTLDMVREARREAWSYAAAAAAAAYATAAAADAAAYAAAAYATAAAADAADAAYAAAYAVAARTKTLAECADIVRTHIQWTEVEAALSQEAA